MCHLHCTERGGRSLVRRVTVKVPAVWQLALLLAWARDPERWSPRQAVRGTRLPHLESLCEIALPLYLPRPEYTLQTIIHSIA